MVNVLHVVFPNAFPGEKKNCILLGISIAWINDEPICPVSNYTAMMGEWIAVVQLQTRRK